MAILVTCEACKETFRVRDEYLDKKAWCPVCRAPITLTGERVPNHEVFISYSNKDKHVADAICAKLESLPLRCWIAPRDVAAGHSWGSSIIEAIEEAKVMVLVYSSSSNLSPQVIREVERAVSKGLVLVPFRVEATMMSKDMEYYLSASHWIDALTPPLEKHLVELGELVRTVLFRKEKEAAAAQKPVQPAKPVPTAPASTSPASQPQSRNKMWIAAAMALVAILGTAGWWFGGSRGIQQTKALPQEPFSTTTTPVSLAKIEGADITVACSGKLLIQPLKAGIPVFNDSRNSPLDLITHVSPEMIGMQLASPSAGVTGWYGIRVNQSGLLYFFGCKNSNQNRREKLGLWDDATGMIQADGLDYSRFRHVAAGETFRLNGWHVLVAAKNIKLVPDGKIEGIETIASTVTDQVGKPQKSPANLPAMESEDQSWPAQEILANGSPPEIRDLFTSEFVALPNDQQFNRVLSKLKELNPKFKGDISCKMNGKSIREIQISRGFLGNLWPLRTLKFTSLRCSKGGSISDLSPLVGLPLTTLFLPNCAHLSDLSPLRGMHLKVLFVNGTQVRDLSPVQAMPLTMFSCKDTPVADLTLVKTMQNLKGIVCDFDPIRDGAILRSIKTLETINHVPVEQFWKRVDAGDIPETKTDATDEDEIPATQSAASTPAATAPPTTAQPGQPWTNSLGMKFVPVPGTAVQFSIWDTRVQDYQAFVTATGRAWPKAKFKVAPSQTDFEQGPTHPAVNVSWDDAKAFCSWLTEKERRAGTLNFSQEYRLPTDLEWSTAVGLQNETGSSPQERNGRIADVYPWGTQWPPPRGAGNYGWKLKVDDFAKTSPVDSFAANQFGLYDMGGNVFQWCDDFWDGQSGKHVSRGSSWWHSGTNGQHFLLSSWRVKNHKDSNIDIGFRCVLAKVGTGASNSAASNEK